MCAFSRFPHALSGCDGTSEAELNNKPGLESTAGHLSGWQRGVIKTSGQILPHRSLLTTNHLLSEEMSLLKSLQFRQFGLHLKFQTVNRRTESMWKAEHKYLETTVKFGEKIKT